MQPPQPKSPPGVIFDSSLDQSIDQVLALALLFGLEGKRQIRVASVSVSRYNLNTAAFLDVFCPFYGGEQPGGLPSNKISLPVGMSSDGAVTTDARPMLEAVLSSVGDKRGIRRLNDTADPVALIRNALTAQNDQSASVILAGPPVNLLSLLAL